MLDDQQLLERYVSAGSEEAFAELVQRHMGLVYSAALRQVGDPQKAQDITQLVFANLARRAGSIPRHTVLAGWLHRDTRFTALDLLRAEARRARREQEAAAMSALEQAAPPPWEQIRPLLDEALEALAPAERDALLLRFFEQRDFAAVGAGLGASAEAARKRVERGLDHLREQLVKRGITTTAAALGATLSAHALEPVPAGLALSLFTPSAAVAATPAAASGLAHLLFMSKTPFVTLLLLGALATPLLVQQQALGRARAEQAVLTARLDKLPQAAQSSAAASAPGENAADDAQRQRAELETLRQEAALLKARVATLNAQAQQSQTAHRPTSLSGTPINQTLRLQDLRDVGQATPAALLESFTAAVLHGDTNRVAQLVEPDPATDPAVLQKSWEGLVQAAPQVQAQATNAASDPRSAAELRLLVEQPAENNDHWLVFESVRNDGSTGHRQRLKLRFTNAGWKLPLNTYGEPINENLPQQP